MAHDVVLIPGDGIGPEITQAMRRVVEATGVQINWNVQEAGAGVMDEFGTPLPQHVLDAVADDGSHLLEAVILLQFRRLVRQRGGPGEDGVR